MDFWISDWISGFQIGFLDFTVDFWISQWISGFLDFRISVWISADGVRDFFRDGPLGSGLVSYPDAIILRLRMRLVEHATSHVTS